jgi:uncharacterized protein (TIGR00251 family)
MSLAGSNPVPGKSSRRTSAGWQSVKAANPHDKEIRAVYSDREQINIMSSPGYLRAQSDGVLLSVKLQPRASANEIGEPLGNELRIKVTAPPVDAAANEALLRLLADKLDCPRGKLELVRGQTSRHKLIRLHGLSIEEVLERLA